MWQKIDFSCAIQILTVAVLIQLACGQGIRFPDQDPQNGFDTNRVGSALAGLTLNQLNIFDSLASEVTTVLPSDSDQKHQR